MYVAPAAVDSRLRGMTGEELGIGPSSRPFLIHNSNFTIQESSQVLPYVWRRLIYETRVWSREGLDYGRWSSRQRSRIGTHSNPRGGADAVWQVRRRAVPPGRPRAGWGGDQGRYRPLRY